MSACITPAGPEFQDPPGIPDSPPYIVKATPEIGSMTSTMTATFSIIISDPNVQDDLHVRWLVDWPETVPGSHLTLNRDDPFPHDVNGKRLMGTSTETIDCNVTTPRPFPVHRVMAVVADRKFDDDPAQNDITAVVDDGGRAFATWVWSVTCPQRQ